MKRLPKYTPAEVRNDPYGFTYKEMSEVIGENEAKALYEELYKQLPRKKNLSMLVKNICKSSDTEKYVYELKDNKYIETVFIKRRDGGTVCVSTQVGCPVGCIFCESGRNGFVRNLTSSEIVQQIILLRRKVNRIVFMGMGEPLFNYDNLIKAIHILRDRYGLNFPTDGKVSYKSKKTRKNEEEQRYFFPNTHEPLVDEETFELAQKRIATRHRPTKAAEIDIFSGLLFCAGCRHKMYYQQGVNIEPRKFSYSCGAWRNRARTGSECTSHYIRKNVLLDLVLEDMRRVLRYVKEHEQDFICKATEYGDMEARKALAQQQKELFKAQARMTELDTLFRKLYEDNALGRLTDERFVFLTSGYEDEKKSLAARIDELQQQIATVTERKRDISRFIQIVGKYSDIQELTYENVHEFIDRILIHELDRETNTRKIEIHYSFVGQVDTEQEPTQVVNHDRRNMVDVKSIAI